MAAALRAAANSVRRECRIFARGFAKLRVNCQQSVAIIVPSTVPLAPPPPNSSDFAYLLAETRKQKKIQKRRPFKQLATNFSDFAYLLAEQRKQKTYTTTSAL